MPPRYQAGNIQRPGVKPVATPVDSFERTAAGQSLSQLAEALSGLAPELRQFTDAEVAGQKQSGRQLADKIVAEGKQIRAGEIGAGEGKYFRMAAKEQFGRLNAGKLASRLSQRMSDPNDPLNQSVEPGDFDNAVAEERQAYLSEIGGEDDPAFMAGFNATANEAIAARREAFARQAGERLATAHIANTLQEHVETASTMLVEGKSLEEIARVMYERNTVEYAKGGNGTLLANTMRQAVYLLAKKNEDESILGILDHIPGGPKNSKLSTTALSLQQTPEVLKEIYAARQQRYNLAATETRNDRNESVEIALDNMYQAIDEAQAAGKSLTTIDPKTFANTVNPADASKVYRAFAAQQRRIDVDDEAIATALWSRANRSTLTFDDVANAYDNGHLTEVTARQLRSEIRANRAGKGAAKALTQEPRLQETKGRLRQLFIDQYGVNAPGIKWRAEIAVQKMENAWIAFRRSTEGQKADDEAVNSWLHNATLTYFLDDATPELRKALKGVDISHLGRGTGPKPVDWQTGAVVPPFWLGQLEAELNRYTNQPNFRLPPAIEATLNQLGIKNVQQAKEFLQRQKQFIPLR